MREAQAVTLIPQRIGPVGSSQLAVALMVLATSGFRAGLPTKPLPSPGSPATPAASALVDQP